MLWQANEKVDAPATATSGQQKGGRTRREQKAWHDRPKRSRGLFQPQTRATGTPFLATREPDWRSVPDGNCHCLTKTIKRKNGLLQHHVVCDLGASFPHWGE